MRECSLLPLGSTLGSHHSTAVEAPEEPERQDKAEPRLCLGSGLSSSGPHILFFGALLENNLTKVGFLYNKREQRLMQIVFLLLMQLKRDELIYASVK